MNEKGSAFVDTLALLLNGTSLFMKLAAETLEKNTFSEIERRKLAKNMHSVGEQLSRTELDIGVFFKAMGAAEEGGVNGLDKRLN